MDSEKYVVVYYNGNEHKAALLSCDHPDSMAPHVWGLPDNCEIICVIEVNQSKEVRVWVQEEEQWLT